MISFQNTNVNPNYFRMNQGKLKNAIWSQTVFSLCYK